MEYIRPKLYFQQYKNESNVPHSSLFSNIAQEIVHELHSMYHYTLDYDVSLWIVRLMSLNRMYGIGVNMAPIQRNAIDVLIKECLKTILGKQQKRLKLKSKKNES